MAGNYINTFDAVASGDGVDLTTADETFLVTGAGSIVDTDNADGVNVGAANVGVTIDGLVYCISATVSTAGTGVYVSGSDSTVSVNGTVQGGWAGVQVIVSGEVVNVGSLGSISGIGAGDNGLIMSGTGLETHDSLFNAGSISGAFAVFINNGGGDSFVNSGNISGSTGISLYDNVADYGESIENSGVIAGGGALNSSAISSVGSKAGVEIVNSGLITNSAANYSGGAAAVLYFDDDGDGQTQSTIDNKGTISGAGYVIQTDFDHLVINNSGTIHGGLYAASDASVDVVNSGLWQESDTNAWSWWLNDSDDGLWNTGTIQASIDMLAGGDTISNAGTIGEGIDLSGSAGNNDLDNSGKIAGAVGWIGGTDTITNSGLIDNGLTIAVGAAGGDTITNSGSIDGGLLFDPSTETLTNAHAGTISGGVQFDGASDKIDNAGKIDGVVTIVSGSDSFINSGDIDGEVEFSGIGETNALTNSGSMTGSLDIYGAITAVTFEGAFSNLTNSHAGTIAGAVTFNGASDKIDNDGKIDGAVTIASGSDSFTNAGAVDGEVDFTGSGPTNTLTNSGSMTGVNIAGVITAVSFGGAFSNLTNSGSMTGAVTFGGANSNLTNSHAGTIAGAVTFDRVSDTIDNAGKIDGAVTILSGSDSFTNS
ncbi:MAG: hypothetical protein ABR929_10505, partial [Roseiarcus sp.]